MIVVKGEEGQEGSQGMIALSPPIQSQVSSARIEWRKHGSEYELLLENETPWKYFHADPCDYWMSHNQVTTNLTRYLPRHNNFWTLTNI